MKLLILNSQIKYTPQADEMVLTENDFHPCRPFFAEHAIQPGSIDYIYTKGVLETTRYIRQVLKIMDYLLAVGGKIEIHFFRVSFDCPGFPLRPLNFLMNEISLCYKERHTVFKKEFENNIDHICLKKTEAPYPASDTIERWTFGIVSDGRKNARILEIIDQIRRFNIPEFEILICGPAPGNNLQDEVKVLDDSDLYFDVRIPISKKKNRIIEHARFNNLVIMHDRISFADNWYEMMARYGNCFEQLCFPILDEETRTKRITNWKVISNDLTLFEKVNPVSLPYNEWSPEIYVDGGFMLLKRHLMADIKLNPYLNWGEMEDVDLSKRLYQTGVLVNFYAATELYSQTHRHKGSEKKKHKLWLPGFVRQYRNKRYIDKRNTSIMSNFNSFLGKR